MDINTQDFLGTGWSFPVHFDKANARMQMVSDAEDIKQSIRIILGTAPGERIMQPEFGCNLRSLLFERSDSSLVARLNHLIYHALLNFEPRINFLEAELLQNSVLEGVLHIRVDYSIISTNTRHNIVFPYYLIEGTNISQTGLTT
jgi:phage baseplate assembly protein W